MSGQRGNPEDSVMRLEAELRGWLAREADRPLPEGLMSAVAAPRSLVRQHGLRLTLPLAFATILLVVLLAAALTLGLMGVLPFVRGDCSRVTIDRVTSALADAPGYTYQAELTYDAQELASSTRTPPAEPFDIVEHRALLAGAYRAPDSWQLEILEGNDIRGLDVDGVPLLGMGYRSFIATGDRIWVQDLLLPRWGAPREHLVPFIESVHPNVLLTAVRGRPLGPLDASSGPFSWESTVGAGSCVLRGTDDDLATRSDGAAWHTIEIFLDPEVAIPERITTDLGNDSEGEDHLKVRFEYSIEPGTPTIEEPATAEGEVTAEEAEAAATLIGLTAPRVMANHVEGQLQGFVLLGEEGFLAMVVDSGGVSAYNGPGFGFDGVNVLVMDGAAEGSSDRPFIFVLVDEPRVARISIDVTGPATADFEVIVPGTGPFVAVSTLDPNTALNRWTAHDQAGREIPELSSD